MKGLNLRAMIGCERKERRESKVTVSLRPRWFKKITESRQESSFKEIYEFSVRHVELETIWGHPNGIIRQII